MNRNYIYKSQLSNNDEDPEYSYFGYHPVFISEIYDKYKIIEKIGYGGYSTVWKVEDIDDNKEYAMKILKSDPDVTEIGIKEIKYMIFMY